MPRSLGLALVCLFWGLAGLFSFGRLGLEIVIGLELLTLIILFTTSERKINQACWGRPSAMAGLSESINQVRKTLPHFQYSPRVMILPELSPILMVARSFGGKGTVFISEGVFRILNEGELRAVLQAALIKLGQKELVWESFWTHVALQILRFLPSGWVDAALARPLREEGTRKFSLNVFVAAYLYFLLAFCRGILYPTRVSKKTVPTGSQAFLSAATKIDQTRRLWSNSWLYPNLYTHLSI